jgi:hypothetical protein
MARHGVAWQCGGEPPAEDVAVVDIASVIKSIQIGV